jgi:Domain of unknown function (DUF4833)
MLVGEVKRAMGVVDSKTFYVVGDEKDQQGVKASRDLMQKNPNVLFVIARSCNLNLVAYEAVIDQKCGTRLFSDKPLDIYWLNLEKKYANAARKKQQPHDRDELSFIERKLAYGAKTKTSSIQGTYKIKMNALPSLSIHLGIDPKTNRPRALVNLDPTGKLPPGTKGTTPCFLERIYVNVVMKTLTLPDVDWYVYYGVSAVDGKPIQQTVVRHPKPQKS